MSDLARRAFGALPRLVGQPSSGPVEQPHRVEVTVRADPELLARCADDGSEALVDDVRRLGSDLGLAVDVALTTSSEQPPDGAQVEVSVGGRPVAVCAADAVRLAPSPGTALSRLAVRGILRRLPLLLDPRSAAPELATYVLSVGCAPPPEPVAGRGDPEAAEWAIERTMPDEMVLDVPAEAMRRVGGAGWRAVADLREAEFRARGIRYPDLRVRVVDAVPGTARLRLNQVTLPPIELPDDADWAHVVGRLGEELVARRHWFIRSGEVERLLSDEMEYLYPELVSAARRTFSVEQVTACLRELLRSGRRIRNVPRIIWLMLEQGDAHGGFDVLRLSEAPLTPRGQHADGTSRDPVVLAARVRKIAIEEAWRLGSYSASAPANTRRLDEDLERRLLAAGGVALDGVALGGTEWEVVRAMAADPEADRVVTRTIEAIGPVRGALQALDRPVRVFASQELPPDADLELFPVVDAGRRGHVE